MGEPAFRPLPLTLAQGAWLLTSCPFQVLGVVAVVGPPERLGSLTEGLPPRLATLLSRPAGGVAVVIAATVLLLLALCVGPGRPWARSGVVALVAFYDAALTMAVLAAAPAPARLVVGVAVVVVSLAGVVLCYRPAVERYLGRSAGDGAGRRSRSGAEPVGAPPSVEPS